MSGMTREIYLDGKAEGIAEGEAKGRVSAIISLFKDGALSIDNVAKALKMSIVDFKKLADTM